MKALFVIDMQNVCVGENHAKFFTYDNQHLLEDINRAIDANKDNLVIYIRKIMKKNLINKLAPIKAYKDSFEVELVTGLNIVSNNVFDKYTGDAFSNQQLIDFLVTNKVDEIEVVGVDGGGCVTVTALGAIKKGYKVIVNTSAIGTMFHKKKEKKFKKLKENGARFI